jgi:hypothetical protein
MPDLSDDCNQQQDDSPDEMLTDLSFSHGNHHDAD